MRRIIPFSGVCMGRVRLHQEKRTLANISTEFNDATVCAALDRAFALDLLKTGSFIDGTWVEDTDGPTFPVLDPASRNVLCRVADHGAETGRGRSLGGRPCCLRGRPQRPVSAHWIFSEYDLRPVNLPPHEEGCNEDPAVGVNPNATFDCDYKRGDVRKVFRAEPDGFDQITRNLPKDKFIAQVQDKGSLSAVCDVSLDVHRSEILMIMGLSGSGKSTLLRCLSRLVEPSADLRRNSFTTVFQSFGLLGHLNVRDNVVFPLRVQNVPKAKRIARTASSCRLRMTMCAT